MTIKNFLNYSPRIASTAYIDDSAVVSGEVEIADEVSIWPTVVIRGDVHFIRIGVRSNIQDGSILHVTDRRANGGNPLIIGEEVTVGHRAVLHGCTIGNRCLIGIGAIILDGANIPDDTLIGAGSLVSPNKQLSSGFLWLGTPARQVRPLTDVERQYLRESANHYVELKEQTEQSRANAF